MSAIDVEDDQYIRKVLCQMIEDSQEVTMASIAKRCNVNYHTIYSIVCRGKEPKEKTIVSIVRGCELSFSEVYPNSEEIVLKDEWTKQFVTLFEKASMEKKMNVLRLLQEGNPYE